MFESRRRHQSSYRSEVDMADGLSLNLEGSPTVPGRTLFDGGGASFVAFVTRRPRPGEKAGINPRERT